MSQGARAIVAPVLTTALGVLAALAVFDAALAPFFGDSFVLQTHERRQHAEGISTSHYRIDDPRPLSWRLTDNPAIEGAPVGLVIGDSYVVGRQVDDGATMGAHLERRSRAAGRPLNVRQYGLSSGSAPAYAAYAEALLARWNPAWVVVVLATNDLGDAALADAPYWRMRIDREGAPEIFEVAPPAFQAPKRIPHLELESPLWQLLSLRWAQHDATVAPPQPRAPHPDIDQVPRASVALLARAYGQRLRIVHLLEMTARTNRAPSRAEVALARACTEWQVPYASTSEVFLDLRDRGRVHVRGFHNTMPGYGHLNELGHRVTADVIWDLVERASARDTPLAQAGASR